MLNMNKNTAIIFGIFAFALIFLTSLSGTIVGVKIAKEKRESQLAGVAESLQRSLSTPARNPSLPRLPQGMSNPGSLFRRAERASREKLASMQFAKTGAENWCSTSYIYFNKKTKEATVKDCRYEEKQSGSDSNEIYNKIEELYKCIASDAKKEGTRAPSLVSLYNNLCLGKTAKEALDDINKKIPSLSKALGSQKKSGKVGYGDYGEFGKGWKEGAKPPKIELKSEFAENPVYIPQVCLNKLKEVQELKKKYLQKVEEKASQEDMKQCKFKGVANCYQESGSADSYKCIAKNKKQPKFSPSTGPGTTTTPPPYTPPSYTGNTPSWQQGGGWPNRGFGNGANTKPQTGSNKKDPCANPPQQNYNEDSWLSSITGSLSYWWEYKQWQRMCGKADSSDKKDKTSEKLTCNLEVSNTNPNFGEEVSVSWVSTGAAKAMLVGPGLSSNSEEGSEKFVATKDSKIKLIVLSRSGKKQVCEKEIQVKMPDKDSPVKVLCTPERVAKGETINVSWACPYMAELSRSDFGATEDTGSKDVKVENDKVFNVFCRMPDGTELSGSCSVKVEKPKFEIIAYPSKVHKGERIRVSWASLFASCSVTGPGGFFYNNPVATVITVPFTLDSRVSAGEKATYTIKCADESKSVSVELLPDNAPAIQPSNESGTDTSNDNSSNLSFDKKYCPHFTTYYSVGDRGGEIYKIQKFLKEQGLYSGPINGVFDNSLEEAVRAFQARYADDILRPWGLTAPTGKWYQSTRKKANELLGCDEGRVRLDNGNVI